MIEDAALLSFLQTEEMRSVDTTLIEQRVMSNQFYRGEPFGDEVEGRSQLRTRDVAEVIDYMTVSIMRTLASGDRICEFEPRHPGQEDLAQEATDRIHYNFLREQDGYAILHDGIKAGLIEKTGVWKSWVERPLQDVPARLNAAQIEAAEAEGQMIAAAEPVADMYDIDDMGEPVQVYDVVLRVPGEPVFRDEAIPNEEFFVAADARTLDTAAYLGNTSRVALYELVEMGYPEDQVAGLWGDEAQGRALSDSRDAERQYTAADVVRGGMHRIVTLREEYLRWNHGGRYQLVRVHRVHNTILSVEPVEFQPYTLWCPFPSPHRLIGQSGADKVMDIQIARSHLMRQAFDNLYLSNAPRQYVNMSIADATTINDLLDVAPGGLVRGKGPNAVETLVTPFVAEPAFTAMERMAGEKESRTGITRLNQGLDADALNKTATGTALMQASGQQIEEYVARNAANAVGQLFQKKLRLMAAEMEPHQFRLDGQERTIDPSQWPIDMRLNVRVGLGSGNKDRQLQAIAMLKQAQAEAYELDPRMVTPEHAFATAKQLTSVLNMGPASQFFADPSQFEDQPEGPSPEQQAMVMEMQAKQALQAAELDLKRQEAAEKAGLAREEAAAKLEAQREEHLLKIELERVKAEAEIQLAREKAHAEMQLRREEMTLRASMNATLTANRPGGDLDK